VNSSGGLLRDTLDTSQQFWVLKIEISCEPSHRKPKMTRNFIPPFTCRKTKNYGYGTFTMVLLKVLTHILQLMKFSKRKQF
jgi:hypothetical protein